MRLRSIRIMAVAVVVAAMFDSELMAGVNQWTRRGPPGGEIAALVADPRNPSTLYIVAGGGVSKTEDGGASWRALLNDARITTLVMPPGQSTTLFAGTGTGAIMRSLDGGLNWATVATRPTWIESIAFDGATIYALAGTSGLRSDDNGTTWTQFGSEQSWGTRLSRLAADDGKLYALDGSFRLRVSRDSGLSWEGPLHGRQLVTFLAYGSTIVIGAHGPHSFRSLDEGRTWESFPTLPGSSKGYLHLRFLKHGDSLVAAGDAGVFRFSEESKSWTQIGTALEGSLVPLLAADAGRLLAFDAGTQFLYGLGAGQADWSLINTNLMEGSTTDLAVVGTTVYAASSRGLMRVDSNNASAFWEPIPISTSAELTVSAVAASSPRTIIAGTKSGLHKSEDAGATWTLVSPKGGARAISVAASDVASMYAALAEGMAKSTDGGSNWVTTQANLPLGYYFWLYGFHTWGMHVDAADPKTVYVSAEEGLYKTVDAGTSWKQISRFMVLIAGDHFDPSVVYTSHRSTLSRSDDGGATWNAIEGVASNAVQAIASDPARHLGVYVGMSAGRVQYSANGGRRWLHMNRGLPAGVSITKLATDDSGKRVFAATPSGVFEYERRPEAIAGASTLSVSLRTFSSNFVSAENCSSGDARVTANATAAGPCETFTLIDANGGGLENGDVVHLLAANGSFVAAEEGGSRACGGCASPLVADRLEAGAWESFTIQKATSASAIANGDSISLRAMAGDYVAAEEGGRNGCSCDSILSANRAAAREWETFNLIIH